MKIELLDVNKLIAVNKLRECSSPRLYGSGREFDPQGILSNDIFGLSQSDRKSTFAYIDLRGPYFNPHIYAAVLKPLYKKVIDIVSGQRKFKIVDNFLVEDENGKTGIQFLYDNWEKIDWSKTNSRNTRSVKVLMNAPKDQIFISKFIIIPAGYRDMLPGSISGGASKEPQINRMYKKLIGLVAGLSQNNTGNLFTNSFYPIQANIQNCMVEIYDEFQNQIKGKMGYIKRYLMGKSISFGTRSVISSPSYNHETLQDSMVDIDHTALPLAQCCAAFKPFIVAWMVNFFQREIIDSPDIVRIQDARTGKIVGGTIKDPEVQFSDKVIDKMILNFVRNPDSRFQIINISVIVPTENNANRTIVSNLVLRGKTFLENDQMIDLQRPLTITDVLYLACVDVCEKRHVMVSRYPVGTDKGIFFNKVRVESTMEKMHVVFNGKDYPFYPKIDLSIPRSRVAVQFIDTAVFSNSLLKGCGADYDGDTVSIRGLWSDEANAEAEKIMTSKMSALTITGGEIRSTEKEIYNSYYELTRTGDKQVRVPEADANGYLALTPDGFTRSKIVSMIADTVDSSKVNATTKRRAKHSTWDTMTIPANYFYQGQKPTELTLGQFLFNKYVLEGAGIIERTRIITGTLNAKGLNRCNSLVNKLYLDDLISRQQFNAYIDRRDNLGYWLNGMLAHTISLRMAKPLKEIEQKKKELMEKYKAELEAGDINTMVKIESELVEYAKELLKDDPGMNLYDSGDLKFENAYKNNSIMKGPVFNQISNEYDFITTSYMNGIDPKDIPAHANTILAGAYPGAVMTRKAGYLGKQLLALLQMAEVDVPDSDCGTKNLIPIKVTNTNAKELVHSYFQDGNTLKLLTEDNVNGYRGKTLLFRSPLSCTGKKFCSKCIGDLPYKLGIQQVGLYAVQISHSLLNLALKSKHDTNVKTLALKPSSIIEDL